MPINHDILELQKTEPSGYFSFTENRKEQIDAPLLIESIEILPATKVDDQVVPGSIRINFINGINAEARKSICTYLG